MSLPVLSVQSQGASMVPRRVKILKTAVLLDSRQKQACAHKRYSSVGQEYQYAHKPAQAWRGGSIAIRSSKHSLNRGHGVHCDALASVIVLTRASRISM